MVPFVEHFYAIEPSAAGVDRLHTQLTEDGYSEKVSLWHSSADQVYELPDFLADFTLINSVTQHFPSEDYLRESLVQMIGRCSPGGCVMLGDVRSASLDDFLAVDIFLERWKEQLGTRTVQDLLDSVAARRQYRTELLIDPSFFFDLQRQEPRITHVEIIPKTFPHSNELSRYRYQAVLHVLEQRPRIEPEVWISLEGQTNAASIPSILDEFIGGNESYIAIEQIPNKFLSWEQSVVEIASASSTDPSMTLDKIPSNVEHKGMSAFDLVELAEYYGLTVRLSYARQAEDGTLDAVFIKSSKAGIPLVNFKSASLSSMPGFQKRNHLSRVTREPRRLQNADLQNMFEKLKTSLPSHMLPKNLFAIDWLPLTSSGKLDRRMLLDMATSDLQDNLSEKQRRTNDSPRDEVERSVCKLFSQLLSITSVSLETDFFAQGGHSLLATRLRSGLEREFKVPFPLPEIFTGPTPERIAAKVKELQLITPKTYQLEKVEHSGGLTDLSYAQRRLWLLEKFSPQENAYKAPFLLRLLGGVNDDILSRTIDELVSRHEILRTIFVEKDGIPKSKLTDTAPKLEKVNLDPDTTEEDAIAIIRNYAKQPFDFSRKPPFKPILFKWKAEHYFLCFAMHHIITDGYSHNILRKDFETIYSATLDGKPYSLPDLPIRYKDFAQWQHSDDFEKLVQPQEEYWVSHLRGNRPASFPTDHKATDCSQSEGASWSITCGASLKERLSKLCQQKGVTWFMLLLSVFRAVHFNRTGQSDASVGSSVANRQRTEVEHMLGFFVNTQIFRLPIRQGQTFTDLLASTRELALKAFDNQDLPFDRLVQRLNPSRSAAKNPLVEIMFAFQSCQTSPSSLSNIDIETVELYLDTTRFDLEIHWQEREDGLHCNLIYRKAAFNDSTIAELGGDLVDMLQRVATNPDLELYSDNINPSNGVSTYVSESINTCSSSILQIHYSVPGQDPSSKNGEPDGPPMNETEKQICLSFENVLGVSPITRKSNFFDYGGHSFLVISVHTQLKQAFQVPLEIRDLFEYQTPAQLAKHIEKLLDERRNGTVLCNGSAVNGSHPENGVPSVPPYYAFRNDHGKPFVFCLPTAAGLSTIYSGLSRASEGLNVIGVNNPVLSNPDLEQESFTWSFTKLAKEYLQQILHIEKKLRSDVSKHHGESPLNFVGYSFGGNVAIEVARQALKLGRRANVFILDSARMQLFDNLDYKEDNAVEKQLEKAIGDATRHECNMTLEHFLRVVYQSKDLPEKIVQKGRAHIEENLRRFYLHEMEPYPSKATLFRSAENIAPAFKTHVALFEETPVPGRHSDLLGDRTVQEIVTKKIHEEICRLPN